MSELLLPKKSYFWAKKVTCIKIGVLIQLKLILLVNIAGFFYKKITDRPIQPHIPVMELLNQNKLFSVNI